jgi:hypothetical protein
MSPHRRVIRGARHAKRRFLAKVNGKRGSFIAIHVVLHLAMGLSFILAPLTPGRRAAFSFLPDFLIENFGWVWVAGALIAIPGVFKYAPPRSDRWAFSALVAPPTLYALLYLIAVMTGTYPVGWVNVFLFGSFAASLWVVSDWVNPPEVDLEGSR